jgi:hypothetical protein
MTEYDVTSATGAAKAATTPRTAPPASGAGPDEELKKLKDAQAKDQGELEKLKEKMNENQAKIKDLEKAVAETGQVTAAFTSVLQGVATDRLQIQDFLTNELPQIEKREEVKSKAAEIAAKIKEVNTAIETKEGEQEILVQKVKDEAAALQAAREDQAAKKVALDTLKDQQKIVQDRFAKLRKLRQRIDTEGAGKPLLKYVLALELKTVWDSTKELLVSEEQLEKDYYARADELRAATATVTAQEEQYKVRQGELEATRKDLDARRTTRLDDIVKRVNELGAPAAPAAAVGAGGAAARSA